MTIKAIETRYAGCRFRSRLEARYAVLFDHLGIRWDYEPEGYLTPAGPYLPDFLLHLKRPVLFEVKPESDLGSQDDRWWYASEKSGLALIVAYGMPKPDHLEPYMQPGYGQYQLIEYHDPHDPECAFSCNHQPKDGWGWDCTRAFCVCPSCGEMGIEFYGLGERICGNLHPANDGAYTYDAPQIIRAYRAALSARFEHGERG